MFDAAFKVASASASSALGSRAKIDDARQQLHVNSRFRPNSGSCWHAQRLLPSGAYMHLNPCFLAIAVSLATPALAQPAGQANSTECTSEMAAAIEQDMELAGSKGQMLRRRQLADALAALHARCQASSSQGQSRAANIERLEQEIQGLRKELDHAEEQLRKLKSETP